MIEIKGNILSPEIINEADAICFTSNSVIKKDGSLVMGAGIAKAFRYRFKGLDSFLGKLVKMNGNHVHFVRDTTAQVNIVSFPTKNHWRNPSSLSLIKQSARELMDLINKKDWKKVYLPRPGCSCGGLSWSDVKPELEKILDDRVIIITL